MTKLDISKLAAFSPIKFGGVNIESADRHNEAEVKIVCNEDSSSDAEFSVEGHATRDSYVLNVSIKSDSLAPLWRKSTTAFEYNNKTGHWTMKSFVEMDNGLLKEWEYCITEKTIEAMLDSLACFTSGSKVAQKLGADVAITEVSRSIAEDKDSIIATAKKYKREKDCEKPTSVDTSNRFDGVVTAQ